MKRRHDARARGAADDHRPCADKVAAPARPRSHANVRGRPLARARPGIAPPPKATNTQATRLDRRKDTRS